MKPSWAKLGSFWAVSGEKMNMIGAQERKCVKPIGTPQVFAGSWRNMPDSMAEGGEGEAALELPWADLGPPWAVLGPSCGYLGAVVGDLGFVLGRFGRED